MRQERETGESYNLYGERPSLSWPDLSFIALLGDEGFGIAQNQLRTARR